MLQQHQRMPENESSRSRFEAGRTPPGVDHRLKIEIEREGDGRWLAAVVDLPGVMAYGTTPQEAFSAAEKLALQVILDRLEHGEDVPEVAKLFLVVA
jgi:predicted RNase H-like HicB family nuclease